MIYSELSLFSSTLFVYSSDFGCSVLIIWNSGYYTGRWENIGIIQFQGLGWPDNTCRHHCEKISRTCCYR